MGPPGPPGPPGPAGLSSNQYLKEIGYSLKFEVFLFQADESDFTILQATPYLVSPTGNLILGSSIAVNLMSSIPNSFISLSSAEKENLLEVSSPEYGTYHIGVNIFSQKPLSDKQMMNLHLGAHITSYNENGIKQFAIEIPLINSQRILHSKGMGIQLQTFYTYIPFNITTLH